MTAVDEYLAQVRASMLGMDPKVREDILLELRSHLTEAAAANGGDVGRALEAMGPAVHVGRGYRVVYGYSRGYQLLFAAVAAVLAALTLPVLQGATSAYGNPYYLPNLLALPFLVLVMGWLLWVSVQAGSRAGLAAGLGAFMGRMVLAAALILGPSGGIVTLAGVAVLVVSSALLVLVGWLPGTAKRAWSRPAAEL